MSGVEDLGIQLHASSVSVGWSPTSIERGLHPQSGSSNPLKVPEQPQIRPLSGHSTLGPDALRCSGGSHPLAHGDVPLRQHAGPQTAASFPCAQDGTDAKGRGTTSMRVQGRAPAPWDTCSSHLQDQQTTFIQRALSPPCCHGHMVTCSGHTLHSELCISSIYEALF